MTGKVEIINIALARLGESPIQSLGEGSAPADAASLVYDFERRAALRDYNWNFATRQTTLARLEKQPLDFRFAYALPPDCLRVARVWEGDHHGEIKHVVRGDELYTNSGGPVCVEYVADIEDGSLFDAKFAEALSYKIAAALAMPIKGSSELMASFMNVYQSFVKDGATVSSSEKWGQLPDNPYVDARN